MRSTRQKLYDDMYYGFERVLNRIFHNRRIRKSLRGIKFGKEFQDAFKNEIRPYWSQFGIRVKPLWFKYYYHLNGSLDPRFIPDDIHFYYIVPHFDNFIFMRPMEDKNLHTLLFPGVKRPETVFKWVDNIYRNDDFSPISSEEAFSRLQPGQNYILKPTMDTGQGQDILFFRGVADPAETARILMPYKNSEYIVQRILTQHPALSSFNPSSVNTIRVVTLMFRDEPHILSAILRIGHPGSRVDNVSQGGYQAIIRPDGTLDRLAYTKNSGTAQYVEQTDSGIRFEGFPIPSWDKISRTALDLSARLPHLRFIGWDFAVNENGEVVLIEFNCQIGQNQENCGPTFGDMTEEVLGEVFRRRMEKHK